MQEGFQHRSQTKSKVLFFLIFIVIGAFLLFKLTQDGSKYANPFGLPTKDKETTTKTKANPTNETKDSSLEKNKGILKGLLDKLNNFNETLGKFDEKVKNYTSFAKDYFNSNEEILKFIGENANITGVLNKTLETLFDGSINISNYDEEKKDLLQKLQELKEAFEKAGANNNIIWYKKK